MTFCYSPWSNIDISPQGVITPCCKFQTANYSQSFNIQDCNLDDYVGSAFLAEIKQNFTQGQWPQGCNRCRIEEENNIASKRQLDHDRWKNHYDQYDIDSNKWLTASIAFGNTCNLKCITCGPDSSSKWQSEYQSIYNINIEHVKFYRKDFIEKFIEQAPEIIHLDIPGGEPFLSGVREQKQLLSYYIKTGQAKNISLHYTTNVTLFPDQEWWKIWEHFKNVDIQLSIDGVGNKYEYIRYPAMWADVVENTNQYLEKYNNNIQLSVSHTVSAYNIYYLDEFFAWCEGVGLPKPWLGRVHNPIHMRPTVWPTTTRNHIAERLKSSNYTDVRTWAQLLQSQDDSDKFVKFKTYLLQHDQYRGLKFAEFFPELSGFLNDQ
jgi:MoaA/NifB/PqqE/SkfB family radical SAM enzyme